MLLRGRLYGLWSGLVHEGSDDGRGTRQGEQSEASEADTPKEGKTRRERRLGRYAEHRHKGTIAPSPEVRESVERW
jgi:hypothetical protein